MIVVLPTFSYTDIKNILNSQIEGKYHIDIFDWQRKKITGLIKFSFNPFYLFKVWLAGKILKALHPGHFIYFRWMTKEQEKIYLKKEG